MQTQLFRMFALLVLCASASGQAETPAFSFGVIADVQYADKDRSGTRHYRSSLVRLEQAVAALNEQRLAFTVHLGDFIDDGLANLRRLKPILDKLESPKHHVIGNHDFCLPREKLIAALDMPAAYHDFVIAGVRFIVLDGMNESLLGHGDPDSEACARAREQLAKLKARGAKNAHDWNGGVGPHQRAWLEKRLALARTKKERVIVFCHLPAVVAASTHHHVLWDHEKVATVLKRFEDIVIAYMNGHDHKGGYARVGRIHFLTLEGMVEAPKKNAFAVVDVYRDRLEVRGYGKVKSRTLMFAGNEKRSDQ